MKWERTLCRKVVVQRTARYYVLHTARGEGGEVSRARLKPNNSLSEMLCNGRPCTRPLDLPVWLCLVAAGRQELTERKKKKETRNKRRNAGNRTLDFGVHYTAG